MKCFVQHGPYVAIDFETSASTGPCACAVGLTRVENFEIQSTFYTLIRPPSSSIRFTHIHGLKWEDLKNEKPFPDVWPEIKKFIAGTRFFVAHNAVFDRKILHACCSAYNIPIPKIQFLCTLLGARRLLKLPRNNLASVCDFFGIPLNHHHAGSDASACAQVHIHLRKLGLKDEQMKPGSSFRNVTTQKTDKL